MGVDEEGYATITVTREIEKIIQLLFEQINIAVYLVNSLELFGVTNKCTRAQALNCHADIHTLQIQLRLDTQLLMEVKYQRR